MSGSALRLKITSCIFFVSNSRPEVHDFLAVRGNIGLKNVKDRLQLLYPFDHELNIIEEPGTFSVFLKIRLTDTTIPLKTDEVIKQVKDYAVA